MRMYFSKTSNRFGGIDFNIEEFVDNICLNPNYNIPYLKNKNINIIMDSGAFQDKINRITFDESMLRQLKFEDKLNIVSERIVSYDMINDYLITIKANKYLNDNRKLLQPRQLVFVVQGYTVFESADCIDNIMEYVENNDCIGFGGIASIGRDKKMQQKLYSLLNYKLDIINSKDISDLHFFGIGSFDIIKKIKKITNDYNFNISFDSSSFEYRSMLGYLFNKQTFKMEKKYVKEQKMKDYNPNILALENIMCANSCIELL